MSAGYADTIPSDSFLEYAFLRWVLTPAATDGVLDRVHAQAPVHIDGHDYRLDYEIRGNATVIAIELDGFAVHGTRSAFTYDRMRQNDVTGTGRAIARFSYDAIRTDTARCVMQLQALLARDPLLATFVRASPVIETPQMDPDPLMALSPSPRAAGTATPSAYFAETVAVLDIRTLRECQRQAFTALSNYYATGGKQAACVMSVGAGKTVLGVAAVLSFTRRRALVVTPGNVIRGTFDRAFDPHAVGNALYGLPGGPLIPGQRPPAVLTLDRAAGGLRNTTRAQLLAADVIVTNFHSLGTGASPEDLLAKLDPEDIDMIVIDEAHIAAAASYQRLFAHFSAARTLLMSACFTRLDGKPIDADVVYRYRLIDSIADGNAKNMRIRRFEPDTAASIYEVLHPDGRREELVGRDALLAVLGDERKLANITAKSTEPIHRVMRVVAAALAVQRELLYPVKPRVLFAALGRAHAEQIATIAAEHGIGCGVMHHALGDAANAKVLNRFESDSGDLDAIAQLRMLGQGYDFPPICITVPLRPYGSFSEFYQFIGRGIRVLLHPALTGRVGPDQQFLDVVLHSELGLDEHLETLYAENDMDPVSGLPTDDAEEPVGSSPAGISAIDETGRLDAYVLFERGELSSRIVHDEQRIEARRSEREREALAARYAEYAANTTSPVSFDQYLDVMRALHDSDPI